MPKAKWEFEEVWLEIAATLVGRKWFSKKMKGSSLPPLPASIMGLGLEGPLFCAGAAKQGWVALQHTEVEVSPIWATDVHYGFYIEVEAAMVQLA